MSQTTHTIPDCRERILEGARTAFMRFGFERTSMADIAAGAGVTRTALYHYFESKEDVLRAVIDDLDSKMLEAATQAAATATTLNTALTALLTAWLGEVLRLVSASPHADELLNAGARLKVAAEQRTPHRT
jgi:AcrR family transcriptional regulator